MKEQTQLQQILNFAKDNAKAVIKLESHQESTTDRLAAIEARLDSIDKNQADADQQLKSINIALEDIMQMLSDIEGKEGLIIKLLSPEPEPAAFTMTFS